MQTDYKGWLNTLFIIIFLLVAFIVVRNIWTGEESRVKKTLRSIERAVERRDIVGCMWHIASDYSDDLGMDYQGVAFFLKSIFETYNNISVSIKDMKIDVRDNRSVLSFVADIRATGGPQYEAGNSRFNVSLRKEGSVWKVYRSEIEEK